jgi:hypothetical protein
MENDDSGGNGEAREIHQEEDAAETDIKAAQRRLDWVNSPEFRKGQRIFLLISGFGCAAALLILYQGQRSSHTPFDSIQFDWKAEHAYYLWAATVFTVCMWLASSYRNAYRRHHADRVMVAELAQLEGDEAKLANSGDLELTSLWLLTQQRLSYYHQIATEQARQSFRNAQIAIAAGFVVLLFATGFAVYAKTTTGSIVTGALGALGATLAGYIGKTFVPELAQTSAHLGCCR